MSDHPKPKIGQGSLQAFLRKGFREAGEVIKAFPTSISVADEAGQLWSVTQQAASQQTGASQPIHYSNQTRELGSEAVHGLDRQQPSEVPIKEGIVEGLVENAVRMKPQPEREMEVEK